MTVNARDMDFKLLNDTIRKSKVTTIENCLGQRFIASGASDKKVTVRGTPGNALGAYLDGASITVYGNAQDAVGDTMNGGSIVVHGNVGDAAGYAMRGGEIYVRGSAGYRAGIHMKAYKDKLPVMVIGGSCGSFLGEYQVGGIIIVLGLDGKTPITGGFCGTGMHGGKIFLRTEEPDMDFPRQVKVMKADASEIKSISKYLKNYCRYFGSDAAGLLNSSFYVLSPNSENPYKQMYIQN